MALFSRRRDDSRDSQPTAGTGAVGDAAADATRSASAPGEAATAAADAEQAPSVGISVSSFRGLGVQNPPAPVDAADDADAQAGAVPAPTDAAPRQSSARAETVPGLRDNVLLREALARLPESPSTAGVMDAARQLLQGHLFLRVKGDARALLAEGAPLPLASATLGGRRFAVAYSSGRALADSIRVDGDTDSTAMGQPVLAVLRHALDGSADGLVVDPASAPARMLLPRDLLERMVATADPQLSIKTLLAGERTPETAAQLAQALASRGAWAAVGRIAGSETRGLAEGRTADGARYLELYSHPLEVVAMGRGDDPTPITAAQLAAALRAEEGLAGVVLDSRGPWMRLTRDDLAPVLALAS